MSIWRNWIKCNINLSYYNKTIKSRSDLVFPLIALWVQKQTILIKAPGDKKRKNSESMQDVTQQRISQMLPQRYYFSWTGSLKRIQSSARVWIIPNYILCYRSMTYKRTNMFLGGEIPWEVRFANFVSGLFHEPLAVRLSDWYSCFERSYVIWSFTKCARFQFDWIPQKVHIDPRVACNYATTHSMCDISYWSIYHFT